MTMPANRAEFRISQAMLDAAVQLQIVPTCSPRIVPRHYSPTDTLTYWVDDLAGIAGHAQAGDGSESSEVEFGRRLPDGSYTKVETGGAQRTLNLRHYGFESNLDDEEARLAMRNFGLDRGEVHAAAALQTLRVAHDMRLNAKLVTGTFTNNAARSGVWTSSSTTNNYIKADTETALDAILTQSGYSPASVEVWLPENVVRSLQRAPELNERVQNYQTPPINMSKDAFLQYLANYMEVKAVHRLDSVRNTAKFMATGAGAHIFTGDDVLFTVVTGDNTGNNGVFWGWTDTDESGPNGNPEVIWQGRNPKDEHETYRARETGNFGINVELTYLITAVAA